ncbi:MAG: hypothetical protein ACYDDG_06215 [Casimicrobiaceae bacterium]
MRRNRRRGKFKGGNDTTLSGENATLTGEGSDVPTLTDALAVDAAVPLAPTLVLPDAGVAAGTTDDAHRAGDVEIAHAAHADPISLDTLADLPVLTDAVEIADDAEVARLPARTEMLEPLVPEEAAAFVDQSATSPVAEEAPGGDEEPGSAAGVPSEEAAVAAAAPAARTLADDEFILESPPAGHESATPAPAAVRAAAPAAAPAPAIAAASPDWDALADEIRSQVLQRLDLFTDTGLREQLGARLQPIVERASAELVDTINRQVGELIRSYIAEAIEREIDSWRSHHS